MVITKSSEFHMYVTLCVLKTIIKIKLTVLCDEFINKQPHFYPTNTADIAYKFDSCNNCSKELQTDQK